MYDGRQLLCFSSIREKITFNENALLRDQRKKWVILENQHYILNIEDIFTKFTGHPMNWTNMMSLKGQVQKESRLRELIRYMFYSVQTEFDSVQSADKLSASNIYSSLTYIYPALT